jgi:N-methylhydantoinase A
VVAATRAGAAAGLGDLVSVDMGGTSFDLCLVRGGRPEVKRDWSWRHRYCIATPMVDVQAIGAGGGSLVRAAGGRLTVGPESAGSEPGPVSYGRGGTEPTVTDADLVLGRLDPAGFWGGRLALDEPAARAAFARVGNAVGLDADAAAAAAVRLVDAHMADAVRRVLSEAGADPRALDLVAFGGMGGVHATALAAALGIRRVLVPRAAPGFSALGLLTADHVVDDTRGLVAPWAEADLHRLTELADELRDRARAELAVAGVPDDRVREEWMLNLVYPGQSFDTSLPLTRRPEGPIRREEVRATVEEFHRRNEAARLIEARAQEPSIRGVRLVATGLVEPVAPAPVPESGPSRPVGKRRIHVDGGWQDAAVHDGERWGPGSVVEGPAVVQFRFTTLVLGGRDRAEVLPHGDVLVTVPPR